MSKKVIVYTTAICPYCFTLKKFLTSKGIEFEEVDASSDEKIQDFIIEKTGKMHVPVISIDNEYIQGFDREKICELLNIEI